MAYENRVLVRDVSKAIDLMCPWCETHVHSINFAAIGCKDKSRQIVYRYCACSRCMRPIIFDVENQNTIPHGSEFKGIPNIPDNIGKLYKEIRDSYAVGSYTCSVTSCRTLLAHIAVEVDAKPNQSFQYYVKYIEDNCLPPVMKKGWLDRVRTAGNDCVHEFVIADKELAKDMIRLSEVVLELLYNVPISDEEDKSGN